MALASRFFVLAPLLFVLALFLLGSGRLSAQGACPDGRISEIFIDTHSIFDPEDIPEAGPLTWAYELANSAHVSTRESFLRGELLFREGDCYDETVLRETARILRQFRFLARADVFGIPQPDGSHHVLVDTRDEWSTKFTLSVRFEDRVHFDGASLFEENFLGRGATLGVFRVDREEKRDVGGALEIPRLFGTGLDARLVANRTRVGEGIDQLLTYPFDDELDRYALRQRVSRDRDLFAYSLPAGGEFTHVVTPLEVQRMEVSGARRFGVPGKLWMLGGGVSFERVRVGGTDETEVVYGGDFSLREAMSTDRFLDPLQSQSVSRKATRVNAVFGVRRLEFTTRSGLDAVGGVQDLPVGGKALLSLGRSIGATGNNGSGDTFARLELLHGRVGERTVSVLAGSLEGRREDARRFVGPSWRDVLFEGDAFLYLIPGRPLDQTLVLRAAVQGGWDTTSPFQLTLGGPNGVRGYTEHELPGARRVLFSLEDRFRLTGPFGDFVDLGLTGFADLGRIWEGDVPYGVDSAWRGTVGAGLRVGFPAGSSTVLRADIAFPVGPGASGSRPVFRISAHEWVGVLNEFRNPQVSRSRRSGIAGEYGGVARVRSAW
ncbi:MAG: BamA/TamA family outer membrane protein [Gemmatimonadota bacterium]